MPRKRLLLIHGVATRGDVFSPVITELASLGVDVDIDAPDRPATGELATELRWLAPRAEDAFVVGFSGGATLGLALAATSTRMRAALLHEPAVGSLAPGLLAPVASAFERDGYLGFGRALYGSGWTADMCAEGGASVGRELPMFRAFEPEAAHRAQGRVVISVGATSPEPRQQAASALREAFGYETVELPASGHFAVVDNPREFARHVRALIESNR